MKIKEISKQTNVKQTLKTLGISQRNVSAKLDIAERTLCGKLNGKANFTWEEVKAICKMLNIENPFDVFV